MAALLTLTIAGLPLGGGDAGGLASLTEPAGLTVTDRSSTAVTGVERSGHETAQAGQPLGQARSTPPPAPSRRSARPVRLEIAAAGIQAAVVPTDTNEHGVLQVPQADRVGWFERWPAPGEHGPAVVVGHVDSRTGPGALFDLRKVQPADLIKFDLEDGSTAIFRVDRVETHGKDRFPTAAVYGSVPNAQLRLITCTGPFDPQARRYRDNLIVFATLTDTAVG